MLHHSPSCPHTMGLHIEVLLLGLCHRSRPPLRCWCFVGDCSYRSTGTGSFARSSRHVVYSAGSRLTHTYPESETTWRFAVSFITSSLPANRVVDKLTKAFSAASRSTHHAQQGTPSARDQVVLRPASSTHCTVDQHCFHRDVLHADSSSLRPRIP